MPHPGAGATRHSVLAVVVAALLFGTTGTAQTFVPAGTSPLSVGAARLLVGGALLAVIGLVRNLRRAGWVLPRPSASFWWVGLGAACVMAYLPPSPVVTCLIDWKLKAVNRETEPIGRPR